MVRLFLLLLAPALFAADSPLVFYKSFGGSINDSVIGIAVDSSGHVIIAGNTASYDFPVTNDSRNTATQFSDSLDSAGTWRPLGNLPAGLPVALAIDPVTPSTWWAAGTLAIYKSIDSGVTWRAVRPQSGCESYPFLCQGSMFAINPQQPSTVYAIAGRDLVKTTDGGETWITLPPLAVTPSIPSYIFLDPAHPDHLFTAAFTYTFRSVDGGQTWIQYDPPAQRPSDNCGSNIAFDSARENVAYLVDHCELFRSPDGGLTWNTVSGPFSQPSVLATGGKSGIVYVNANDGLYSSADSGITWTLLRKNNNLLYGGLLVDPSQPGVIIAGGQRTADGGATWAPLSLGRAINSVVFDPSHPGRAIAVTQGANTAFIARLAYSGSILESTHFGGQGATTLAGLALDSAGNIYITGSTSSPDLPVTPGALSASGTWFVASFDSSLTLRYATYLPTFNVVNAITVDGDGSAIVAGMAPPAPQAQWQCVATKLSPDGTATVFSTMFGGTVNNCPAVAADSDGNTLVASYNFQQASIHKLDATGKLQASLPVGGRGAASIAALTVDSSGNIYVTGNTSNKNYPVTSDAYQTQLSSNCAYPSSSVATGIIGTIVTNATDDVFLTKLDPAGNLLASTFLGGGCFDVPRSLSLDPQGSVWIAGSTDSSPFPQVTPFETGPPYAFYKAFVARLDAGLTTLQLSSYVSAGRQPSIAADPFGNVYVGGSTSPPESPYSGPPAPLRYITGIQAALAKLQPQPSSPLTIIGAGNAFTLRDGPVSPGQVTLIAVPGLIPDAPQDLTLTPSAPLPRTLAGTQVLFDGVAAPLVSVAPGRVIAVAPYGIANQQRTTIQVLFNGTLSAPVFADVLADISFLSRDGSGTGQALAFNPDGTPNSPDNPAPRSSQVTIYATGVGKVDPACPEGSVATATGESDITPVSVAGYLCGIFQTKAYTLPYGNSAYPLPGSALTIAVK